MSLSKILKFVFVALVLFEVDDIFAQEKDSIIHFIFTSDVHFGLTKERVRQIKEKALRRLRNDCSELFDYLEGSFDLPTAISLIKIHTHQYAKRQMTWFRKPI